MPGSDRRLREPDAPSPQTARFIMHPHNWNDLIIEE